MPQMQFQVQKRDGTRESYDKAKIRRCVERASKGLDDVSISEITDEAVAQLYDGISTNDIDRATILAARSRIVFEPNYSFVAARLLLNSLYKEAFAEHVDGRKLNHQYREAFVRNINLLVGHERLDASIVSNYDLDRLAAALKPERDLQFKYLGLQTLYDRYLLHEQKRRLETPQGLWMRVAMGLCFQEQNPTDRAIEAYEVFSQFLYCPGTPTLFNSCTVHSQLSSCYLSTIDDSIDGIFGAMHNQARLSKYAGGLGVDFTPLRGMNSHIKGTNGESQGVVPWLKIFNDTLVAVNQGGKRKGAGCAYMEPWHTDFNDFLDLRKNTGDDRRRCHDMNTAAWIPDLFLQRVKQDGEWYLFSPNDCPALHETCGKPFQKLYEEMESKANCGQLDNFQKVKAKDLWKKLLTSIYETGHPWITFKDPSNLRYPNQHVGVVHSSNLCTEILLHTKPTRYCDSGDVSEVGETAVCNLGSVNLSAHVEDGEINWEKLSDTVHQAIRLLDNVIDINFYPTPEARNANMRHRPVGLGTMGWHDVLHLLQIPFGSTEHSLLSSKVQEFISYQAIMASASLAGERGAYQTYDGSTWSRGKLPVDTYRELTLVRPDAPLPVEAWPKLAERARDCVADLGMRNSNVMAIAPTATISFIVGCSQSIEPDYSTLFVYSTLSGEFTMVNEHFVKRMKKLKKWTPAFVNKLIAADGDVSKLGLADDIVQEFKTCFDVSYKRLIDAAATRQIWIDQGQSLNLYCQGQSLRELNDMYLYAWEAGLKTTYYLRTKAVSKIEKSYSQQPESEPAQCRIDNPSCESCQ